MLKVTRSKRTIFVPDLEAQYKIWKGSVAPACNKADEVFQLGNLIGCYPEAKDRKNEGYNSALLKLAGLFRSTQESWVQLIGPNEIAALNNPDEWTNQTSRKILRDGWLGRDPFFQVAGVSKTRLVTHGGLTYGEWVSIGKPDTAEEAASRLNDKYQRSLYQGPSVALGNFINYSANPIWCDPKLELYGSWLTAQEECPFGQVHAGSLNNDHGRALIADESQPLHYLDSSFFRNWGSLAQVHGANFFGIDLNLPKRKLDSIPRPNELYIEVSNEKITE
jgi:hypothetical protein